MCFIDVTIILVTHVDSVIAMIIGIVLVLPYHVRFLVLASVAAVVFIGGNNGG
jgi:hypothetical protein